MVKKKRERKQLSVLNLADLPPYSIPKTRSIPSSELTKAQVKLRALIDSKQFEEAKILFSEMVKSSKFHIGNIWKVGAEIVGNISPQELTEYLQNVFINSPPNLSPVTFDAYVNKLMLDKNWNVAIDELEMRYSRPAFHHPIILRKLAVCSYRKWEEAKKNVPTSYFDESEDCDRQDINIIKYERSVLPVNKYFMEAQSVYLRDVEILNLYCRFLDTIKDESRKRAVILQSLESFKETPDYYLIFFLIQENGNDLFFKSKPYILHLYECDPRLGPEYGLQTYADSTFKSFDKYRRLDENNEDTEKYRRRTIRLFLLFIYRMEHKKTELWFLKNIMNYLFFDSLSEEIYEIYETKQIDTLLRSSALSMKPEERKETLLLANQMKENVQKFLQVTSDEEEEEEEEEPEPFFDSLERFRSFQNHPLFKS